MCSFVAKLCVFVFVFCSTVGCSDTAPSSAPVMMTVFAWDAQGEFREPLEGAQLCQTNVINCAVTNASGKAAIELPVAQEISYTLEKEGYASYLFADVLSPGGSQFQFGMLPNQLLASQHGRLMSPYPTGDKGTIALELRPPFAGVTFDLVGAAGKAYYVDEERNWSSDLAATTSQGRGGFVEVSPGTFQVELGGTAQDCVPRLAWPGDVEDSIRIPVREGYRSFATVRCSVPP